MAIRFIEEEPKSKIRFIDDTATQYKQPVKEQIQEPQIPQGIDEGVRSLYQARRAITDPIETARQPKATAQTALQVAQTAGQIGLPWLSGITTTPATEYGIQRLKGLNPKESANQAAISGGLDLLLTGVGSGISKSVKPLLKKAIPLFTGISEESTEIALKKPEIFKGKLNLEKSFNELGKKAQGAANYIQKEAGKAVGIEKEALKNIKVKFNFNDISNKIDELILSKKFGRETVLGGKDIEQINSISNKIKKLSKGKGMEAGELYAIKKQIDDMVKYDPQVVKKIGTEAEGILKQTSRLINDRLADISPKFKTASKKYSEILNLRDNVLPKLKQATASTNIKNIFKRGLLTEEPVSFLEEFRELDKLAPSNLKFAEKANEYLVRHQFEQWIPKSNILRNLRLASFFGGAGSGYLPSGTKLPVLAGSAFIAAGTTPKVYKSIIKSTQSPLVRAIKTPIGKGATKQTATRLLDLLDERKRSFI